MELEKRLNKIKIENYVWIIYIFIILLSFYSNKLETKYFVSNDLNAKNKYRNINIFIFIVILFIYVYFFNESYNDYKENANSNNLLVFVASLMLVISGIIYLYIAIKDTNLEVELAFN